MPEALRAQGRPILARATTLLILMSSTCPVTGQELSLGVIGGVFLNDDFRSRPDATFSIREPATSVFVSQTSSSFRPRIGPKVELDLGQRWAIEADILFHQPTHTETVAFDPPFPVRPGGPPVSQRVDRTSEPTVEIPLLVKHRFRVSGAALILEGGPSLTPFGGFDSPQGVGVTAGVGVAFPVGPVRLQPTVRYSRWSKSPEEERDGSGFPPYRRDRVSLLVAADVRSAVLGTTDRVWDTLSIGFIGGTTLTQGFPDKDGFSGVTTRLAGIAFEHQWSSRWGLEADVLYHPLVLSERARATVLTWELPVLLKRRFASGKIRPVLLGGPCFRLSGNRNSTNPSVFGLAAGAGIEARRGRFSVSPTLRYVHWTEDDPPELSPGPSKRNQIQALVAIRFGGR